MEVNYNLIDPAIAQALSNEIVGCPTENRVLIAVNPDEKKTTSGLYVPGTADKDLPKKGVVVKKGPSNESPTHELIQIGDIVHYGQYGGKEVFPTLKNKVDVNVKYYVLSSSEIIFIEHTN